MTKQSKVELAKFIQSVKAELIKSSNESEKNYKTKNEQPLLQLNSVELEVKFEVERSMDGNAKLFVFNAGSSIQSTQQQSARLKFNVIPPYNTPPNEISIDENGNIIIPITPDNLKNFGGVLHVSSDKILNTNITSSIDDLKI